MSTLQKTRSLNNQGVELLILGQSSAASTAFKDAIQLLGSEVAEDNGGGQNGENVLNDQIPELALGQSQSAVPDLQAQCFFVYNQAITILEGTVLQCNDETISLHSSVILFNWALVFHREGMLGNEKALKKAWFLYARCLKVLSLSATAQSKQSSGYLALLALNNQAQIHYELCDYAESYNCMAQVADMINRTPSLEYSTLTLRNAVKEIYLNTMLSPTAAHAA
jgi:hypothetical protein